MFRLHSKAKAEDSFTVAITCCDGKLARSISSKIKNNISCTNNQLSFDNAIYYLNTTLLSGSSKVAKNVLCGNETHPENDRTGYEYTAKQKVDPSK